MIEHLSHSSIMSYLTCGRAWRYHYVDRLPEPTTPALAFGSAFHDTVEALVTAATLGRETANPQTLFSERFAAHIEQSESIDWQDTSHADQIQLATRIFNTPDVTDGIKSLRAKVDADGKPMIERKVELRVPDVPVPVIGFIDVILADGTPADFKTASRAWTQAQAEKSLQSLVYLAALNQAGEKINWRFQHLVVTKTLNPKFQILEHGHESRELFFLFDLIVDVWRGIEAGVFTPNPDCWKCSPKWCAFYGSCRGG